MLSTLLASAAVLAPLPRANENVAARAFTDLCWSAACLASGGITPLVLDRDVALRAFPGRGLGVVALRPIEAGTFLCRYEGVLRDADAHANACNAGQTSLDYNWGLGDEWHIDAEDPKRVRGSWARYINHSRRKQNCEHAFVGLPAPIASLLQRLRLNVPTDPVAVFLGTKSDIAEGEELFIDYGNGYWDATVCMELHKRAPFSAPLWRLHPRRVAIDYF